MNFTTSIGRTRLPVLAAGLMLAALLPAAAQIPPAIADADGSAQAAEKADVAPDANDADIMKDIDVNRLDWSQLKADASPLDTVAPKRGAAAKNVSGNDASWSSNSNANGTSAVSVKQSISPFWDTRVGADMTVARQGTMTTSEQLSERLANGGSLPQSSGSAWAAITAPGVASVWDKTTVEARVDPGSEQSRFGTSLSKSLPLSDQYSLTLQNGYNVIEQGVVAVPGIAGHTARAIETDQSAKLSINDTGTSLTAGQTLSTTDDKWLRKIGAEQKLFDGVTISGSLGETAQGTTSKSISAGFRRSW
jgi:hypothetical protein